VCGKRTVGGVADSTQKKMTCRAFTWDQMTRHLDGYRCFAE